MATKTLLTDLEEDTQHLDNDIDPENLPRVILDQFIPVHIRLQALEKHCGIVGEEAIEVISTLVAMYQFGGTDASQEIMYRACTHGDIPSMMKLELAQGLLLFSELMPDPPNESTEEEMTEFQELKNEIEQRNQARRTVAFTALEYACFDMKDVPTPCKIEAIYSLMTSPNHRQEADTYFRRLIADESLSCEYRYRAILALENRDIEERNFFIKNACSDLCNNTSTPIRFRILSAQKLMRDNLIWGKEKVQLSNILIELAEDTSQEYNARADAADTLLGLGTLETKERAKNVLYELARAFGDVKNVFENAQNVHNSTIEESLKEIIEFLVTIPLIKVDGEPITLDVAKKSIEQLSESQSLENKEQIQFALNRIEMDRQLYSSFHLTLSGILLRTWSFLINHEFADELKKRLLEELVDMAQTCSSGFAQRLVNVISGYTEHTIRISWNDQITANLGGRLNARMRSICDDDSPFRRDKLQEVVVMWVNEHLEEAEEIASGICTKIKRNETDSTVDITMDSRNAVKEVAEHFLAHERERRIDMCLDWFEECVINEIVLPTSKWNERTRFLLFFRTYLASIREEMYDEFKEYMDDTDFDLGFRTAICSYEGEN